ncbi:MAG TPA: B12-binding domain-containing radical SAM protein, partial [Clostridiales bacterium]|nr:B12-binding domain-containing radical SAM protein [Clostridiales bacterium]
TLLPKGIWYRKNSAINNTGGFDLNLDLNQLPFIDRKLTKAYLYGEKWKKKIPFFYTMSGRDCPWRKCSFCSWTTIYPVFNVRKPDNLLDEIGFLIQEHGAKEIFDDTGTFPGDEWLKKFCDGMIDRGYNKEILFSCNMRFDYLKKGVPELMKKAGFRKIKSGLESANQKTLDRINKGIKVQDIINGCRNAKEEGIDVHLTVMVGYPWETKDDALATLDLAKELMVKGYAEMLQSTVIIPYPGTPLYEEALRNKWFIIDPLEYERYDMTEPVLRAPDMCPDEVMKLCRNIYRIFLSPNYIARHILNIRSFEDIRYIIKGAKAITGHIMDFLTIRK